jgi:dihydroorotate dehydrogenase (NAD+) catalytic subunit
MLTPKLSPAHFAKALPENYVDPASVDMSVDLAGVKLASPMLTASGTCGYGPEYAPYTDLSKLGAFTTKSITPEERKGNKPERIVETTAGMLNAIGLANVGLERFVAEKVPELSALGVPIFVNVAGHSLEDYVAVCRRLDPLPEIAGFELNVSCPNVSGGLMFGTDPIQLRELVAACKHETKQSILIVKLTPNVTDICETARGAIDGGAEVLSMVNTFQGMAIHIDKWEPMLANGCGGVSGAAIKPQAVFQVHQVYSKVAKEAGIPIIGMGGVRTWQDAVEFALAGASAIAVGTALFIDPDAPNKIATGLREYLARKGLGSFRELVGQLKFHGSAHEY